MKIVSYAALRKTDIVDTVCIIGTKTSFFNWTCGSRTPDLSGCKDQAANPNLLG